MLIKYISNEEYYIQDINDIYLISYYLFNCKNLQNFIQLNKIQIRDFIYIISSSKIVAGYNDTLIFKEGEEPCGFYILIKGGIKAKLSKLSAPYDFDKSFKREILQEYNLDLKNNEIIWFEIPDIKHENNDDYNDFNIYLEKKLTFSPFSSIFQQRHEERIKASKRLSFISSISSESTEDKRKLSILKNEEIDIFEYNLNENDILCFGGVNFFNENIRDNKQIHLTSAYFHNQKIENDLDETNNILLYIYDNNLKNIQKKISLLNKERTKFLLNTLTPLNQMTSFYKYYFLSTIKLIYINIENKKEIPIENNIFYLVYNGSCIAKAKKEIIYDTGSFICLNNIFFTKKNYSNETIILTAKGSEVILFKVDINFLSKNNQIKMLKYLANIYTKQYFSRKKYMNEVLFYENSKIKQKEKDLDDKIKEYLHAHGINNFHKTDREIIDKNFQIKDDKNIKNFNNIYINKKNIFKLLSRSKEKYKDKEKKNEFELSKSGCFTDKNAKYTLKKRENSPFSSNSSSHRSSRSTAENLPFLNQSQNSFINLSQNPINIISYTRNNTTGKKSSKNIISRNELNSKFGALSISSFSSVSSLSQYNKSLNRVSFQKKIFFNKNNLLKNFHAYNKIKVNYGFHKVNEKC